MNVARLERLGERRSATRGIADRVHRDTLDAILEELSGDASNAAQAARLTGVARATIYNELARRQQTRDELEPAGAPATPPHDDDDANGHRPRLSAAQARALVELLEGRTPSGFGSAKLGAGQRTLDGLRRRGLLSWEVLELTPAGRQEAGLLAANTTTENTDERTA